MNKDLCGLNGGKWNDCGSVCQGTDKICIQVCNPQCECNKEYKCPPGYQCEKEIKDPEVFGVCKK